MRGSAGLCQTQSCDVWINQGLLQSQVWLSIHPTFVFVSMMAGEEKPVSQWYVVAKERRRHTVMSEIAGYFLCCCFQQRPPSESRLTRVWQCWPLLLTSSEVLWHFRRLDAEQDSHPVVGFGRHWEIFADLVWAIRGAQWCSSLLDRGHGQLQSVAFSKEKSQPCMFRCKMSKITTYHLCLVHFFTVLLEIFSSCHF